MPTMTRLRPSLLLLCLAVVAPVTAQPPTSEPEEIHSSLIKDASVVRKGRSLLVKPQTSDNAAEIQIPRFFASLRKIAWVGKTADGLTLTPEQDYWVIKWKGQPSGAQQIRLDFDQRPLLAEELVPVKPQGDGSILLPAHMAKTQGEKVRYEPQMHKNTVGYWTGKQDHAVWQLEITQAGKFNVGILQGCGLGQGGSLARLEIVGTQPQAESIAIDFTVQETGHFQNFQWRHLGVIELATPGLVELRVLPVSIHKAALMDVRAIHLVRLPD